MEEKTNGRILFLNDIINDKSINNVIKSILEINQEDDEKEQTVKDFTRKPIKLYINTLGGHVYSGLALIDIMKSSKTEIHTIGIGKIMSMGLPILLSGHKRFGGENSTYLIHSIYSGTSGSIKQMKSDIEEAKRIEGICKKIILDNTSIPEKDVINVIDTLKDWYIPAEEALEYGIIHEII